MKVLREHGAIVLVLILFVALGIVYSTTTPLFEAPDEQWHFAFVQHVATGRGLPVQALGAPAHLARQEASQPPLYYLLAAAATFWIDTSDFPDIVWENPHYGYNVPGIVNDNKNLFIHTALENFPWRGAALAVHIARFVSLLTSVLAVICTYLLARQVLNDKMLAASAAAMSGFVPQFLFVGSAVSNDSTIVAMTALALWLLARQLSGDRRAISETIVLGIVCGLAAIAKVSGLGLFVLAAIVLAYESWRRRDHSRTFFSSFALFTLSFGLVAGWWYLRNLILYGELTGTAMMNRIFHMRETPLAWGELLVQLREVWETFWIGFGWGNIRAHPMMYTFFEILVLFGVGGIVIGIVRHRDASRRSILAMLGTWMIVMFAAMIYWLQSTQAPHGRLLFPILPAFGVMLVWGLAQFFVSRPLVVSVIASLFFCIAAIAPITTLAPAYAFPASLSETEMTSIPNRVDIAYDDQIKLLGYDVSTRRVSPGDAIELTLYWQSLAPMNEDYSIGIRVLDAQQRLVGARNSYPGRGMLPTRLWFTRQIIRDAYWLPINADAPSSAAQLEIVMFERVSKRDLVARDPRGEIITPFIGQIEVGSK